MNIARSDVEAAVTGLFETEDYAQLALALGGSFFTTQSIWLVLSTASDQSAAALKQVVRAALLVPPHLAGLLGEFINDLFEVLAIVTQDAPEIAGDAAEGAVTGGTVALTAFGSMMRGGGDTRGSSGAVRGVAAVMLANLTFGATAGTVGVAMVGTGAAVGATVKAAPKAGRTAQKIGSVFSTTSSRRRG